MTKDYPLYQWAAGVVTFSCLTAILVYTKSLIIPLTFALFLFALASRAIRYLDQHFKVPRNAAIAIVIGGSIVVSALLGLFLVVSFRDFFLHAEEYTAKVTESIYYLQAQIKRLGFAIDLTNFSHMVETLPVVDWLRDFSGSAVFIFGQLLLVFVFFMFLIFGDTKNSHNDLWVQVQTQITRYILIKVAASLITTGFVWALLLICRVDLAFPLAVIAGILNFLPSIGPAISVLLPLPLAFLANGFGWQFFTVLGAGALAQFVIGNFIETKMMKDSIDVNPIAVLFSLLFWGIVWGIPGMFLAVPIMVTLKIIFARTHGTRWISNLISGRI